MPFGHSGLFTNDVEFHFFLDVLCEFTDPSCGTLSSAMRRGGPLVLRVMSLEPSNFFDDPHISGFVLFCCVRELEPLNTISYALSLSWSKFAPLMLNTNVSQRANVFMLRGHIVRMFEHDV